jgi:NAD-dependent deacetylase
MLVLTGAGVSAESGIPTFRGKDGYWTVGSREYRAQDLATFAAFRAMPWEVWAWYLYRRTVCRAVEPNAGHLALVRLESELGDRFGLITQNVDGLHRRAGSRRMYAIHGDIDEMRCAEECTLDRWPIPEAIPAFGKGDAVPAAAREQLICRSCGGQARPHILWFDESYDEPRFHLDTVRALAAEAVLLVVVGTSAQTNLPWQIVRIAKRSGAVIVDINVEDNPFGELADEVIREPSAKALPEIVQTLIP